MSQVSANPAFPMRSQSPSSPPGGAPEPSSAPLAQSNPNEPTQNQPGHLTSDQAVRDHF